ncbi:MAG: CoA ester lyase, partial [Sphingomonas sp.]
MVDRPRRSCLFMPASNPRAIAKARTLPCDVVILDLEDAVAEERKDEARAAAVAAAREGGFGNRELVVRVNAGDTRW